jgi:hypothetical protein
VTEQLDTYSTREKNLWVELLTDVAVGLYYWPQAIRLMMAGDEALRGGAMVNLIVSTVMWAIFVSAALAVFLHTQKKAEPMDERDYMIAARSSLLAGRVMVGCVVALICLVVIEEIPGGYTSHLTFFTLSPLVMAHLLLVTLIGWSLTSTIARLYYYRRGY